MKKSLLITLVVTLLVTPLFAEKILTGTEAHQEIEGTQMLRYKDFSSIPAYIKFQEMHRIPFSNWENWMKNLFYKNGNDFGFELIGEENDRLGMIHYRYQQTFQGKPVALGVWIVHTLNGQVVSMNGELFDSIPNKSASLTEEAALQSALDYINAEVYKWESAEEEAWLKYETGDQNATYYPQGELQYINSDGSLKTVDIHLAWKFNIYASQPLSRRDIYISATDGSVVFENDLIHHADSNGVAHTGYLGVQNIVMDYTGGTNFRLRESGRGNGIWTLDMQNSQNHGAAVDFTDNDNIWNPGNVSNYAGDAHFGSEMTYDYFYNHFNRNSIDNNGFLLRSYVHYGNNYGNAFWDGQRMTYGDGSSGNSPFTAIDIAGHEIAHGLTNFTANLIYQYESGALNESFSDIFGAAVEFDALGFGNGDWLMGEDLGFVIRNMANPAQYNDPDTYGAGLWYTGAQDNGGVHINSGVQNYWFYLLTVGGSGTNDLGNNYNVQSIGVNDAAAIAYRNLTIYLTNSSQYVDARFYALEAAKDLFGVCSQQLISTGKAWYAVGVGNDYSSNVQADFNSSPPSDCNVPHTVEFYNFSSNATSYSWNFGDGNTSNQANPTHTYTQAGTYTVTLQVNSTCGNDDITVADYVEIGPSVPCSVEMPQFGSAQTQTDCSGYLFDDGGASGNYSANTNSTITIAPQGAATISLDVLEFNVEPHSTCDYDYIAVYDGTSTTSPQIGLYCNSNPPPSTITSTGGAITIQQVTDGGLELSGFKIEWYCNDPTTPPVANFDAAAQESCDGIIVFNDASTNAAISWSWDFGDGNTSTQKNPTHTYAQDGTYTVTLISTNAVGSDTIVKTNYVNVDRPDAPTGQNTEVCPGELALLEAQGSGLLRWYNTPVGGNVLATGDSFLAGIINNTVPYYVESVEANPPQNLGPVDFSMGPGANFNTMGHYLVFDVLKEINLESVKVRANNPGLRTIELRDSNGATLDSVQVMMNGGEEVIPVGFTIQPGMEYRLGLSASSQINLFRNSSGASYPYEIPGTVSIKRSSANTNPYGYYYFFYDWSVSDNCISERKQINASVSECLGVDELSSESFTVYPNPNLGVFTISWEGNVEQIELINMAGQQCESIASNGLNQVEISRNDLPSGVYILRALSEGSVIQKQIVIQ